MFHGIIISFIYPHVTLSLVRHLLGKQTKLDLQLLGFGFLGTEAIFFIWVAIVSPKALATSTNADAPSKDFLFIVVFPIFLLLVEWLELYRSTVLPLRIRVTPCKGIPFEAPTPPKVLGA